jgi:hypothetical protein
MKLPGRVAVCEARYSLPDGVRSRPAAARWR